MHNSLHLCAVRRSLEHSAMLLMMIIIITATTTTAIHSLSAVDNGKFAQNHFDRALTWIR